VTAFYKSNLKNVKNTLVQGSGDQGMAMFSIGDDGAITVNIVAGKNKETAIQVAKKTNKNKKNRSNCLKIMRFNGFTCVGNNSIG